MDYFVADYHLKHKKILDFEDRPYTNIEEMYDDFIEKWNSVITDNDRCILVGDILFHGKEKDWIALLDKLNGKKILVKGNHDDSKAVKNLVEMGYLEEYHEVGYSFKHEGIVYWVTHYPLEIGERPNKISIHGHIHDQPSQHKNQLNVGVDSPSFKGKVPFGQPIPFSMIHEHAKLVSDELSKDYHLRFK